MNNRISDYFKDVVEISVEGRNVNRFLKLLYINKINLLYVEIINSKKLKLKIYNCDLDKIKRLGRTYEIEVDTIFGSLKLKRLVKKYYVFLLAITFGLMLLYFLSCLIFDVEIKHASNEIRLIINNELKEYNIAKYKLKKDYQFIVKVKEKILNDYKDKIEWIEIEEQGSKYIVRVEERKIINNTNDHLKQHVVAAKSAIIIKINAISGMVLKAKNDYVSKGDIVISGEIKHGENIVDIVKANGNVYGEVWYNIRVELPLEKSISKLTGNSKTILNIKFLNGSYNLLSLNDFKYKKVTSKKLFENRLIPFGLYINSEQEVSISRKKYSVKDAIARADSIAIQKMKNKLNSDEYIISRHRLEMIEQKDKIIVKIFFKVCENITDTLIINE